VNSSASNYACELSTKIPQELLSSAILKSLLIVGRVSVNQLVNDLAFGALRGKIRFLPF
jgi:hypothetical protein